MAVVVDRRWIGVMLGLLGSIGINTGNNLQSFGMHRLEMKTKRNKKDHEMDEDEKINSCKSPMWVFGTVLFIATSAMNFAAFGFAAQSMLASLEAIQFVSNLFFGRCFLDTEVLWRMYLGTALIVGGTIIIVIASSEYTKPKSWTLQSIMAVYTRMPYLVYCGSLVVLAVFLQVAITCLRNHNRKSDQNRRSWTGTAEPVAFAVFSAIFGTQAVVQAKVLAELLQTPAISFVHWFTYVTLVGYVVLVGIWLFRMNDALGKYDAMFIIPLLQASYIFGAIVSGGIFFDEFEDFGTVAWLFFAGGLAFIFTGLYLLRPATKPISQRMSKSLAQGGQSRLDSTEQSRSHRERENIGRSSTTEVGIDTDLGVSKVGETDLVMMVDMVGGDAEQANTPDKKDSLASHQGNMPQHNPMQSGVRGVLNRLIDSMPSVSDFRPSPSIANFQTQMAIRHNVFGDDYVPGGTHAMAWRLGLGLGHSRARSLSLTTVDHSPLVVPNARQGRRLSAGNLGASTRRQTIKDSDALILGKMHSPLVSPLVAVTAPEQTDFVVPVPRASIGVGRGQPDQVPVLVDAIARPSEPRWGAEEEAYAGSDVSDLEYAEGDENEGDEARVSHPL